MKRKGHSHKDPNHNNEKLHDAVRIEFIVRPIKHDDHTKVTLRNTDSCGQADNLSWRVDKIQPKQMFEMDTQI